MGKSKLEVFVDASVKNNIAGIGMVIKRNSKINMILRTRINNCIGSYQAEEMAVLKAVQFIRKSGNSPKRCKVFTDCKGIVERYKGIVDGIGIEWISRDENIAHTPSVLGRRRKGSKRLR